MAHVAGESVGGVEGLLAHVAARVDALVALRFDRALAARSAEEFVDTVLMRGLGARETFDYAAGCGALVLACSGYGGNRALVSRHIPELSDALFFGHGGNQGDAVKWGEELGASIKDMGAFQGHGAVCSPHGMHLGWPTVTEGGFHVNKDGKLSQIARKIVAEPDHDSSDKPLFPISKERT